MKRDKWITYGAILNILLVVAAAFAIRGFILDLYNTLDYGGVDLRNRVVGARLMLEGEDPYYFKWSEAHPDTLLDPIDNPDNPVSRVSVPPTVLMLHVPAAGLPYSTQRIMWFVLQWFLLLSSVFLFARCAEERNAAKAVWIVGLFLCGIFMWRFHVERGQIYILYVFLIALSFWVCRKQTRYTYPIAGILIGIAASMRPTLLLMAIPILIFRKWNLLAGIVAGLLFFVLLSLVIFGVPIWRNYSRAMRYHELDNLGKAQPESFEHHDATIEDMDNLKLYLEFANINTSVQWFFKGTFDIELRSRALLLMMAAAVSLLSLYVFLFRKRDVSIPTLYLVGMTIVLVAEYFIPAIKAYYLNIIWLVPLELIALNTEMLRSLTNRQLIIALFLLLVGGFIAFFLLWESYVVLIGEAAMMLFFLWMSSCFLRASPSKAPTETSEMRDFVSV